MAEPLNPCAFPLWGSRLIEASAGTGKTWTIAALYLRLVLGHGVQQGAGAPGTTAFGTPLVPAQILVMTFTRAATRELSERIRERLLEAVRCFRGQDQPQAGDPLLAELLADHPAGEVRDAAAWRLALAAECMDDAAVHTIDAWCQRMLREHAFDSGCLFDEELAADESALHAQAARDYWRQQIYPLSADALAAALAAWKDVQALIDDTWRLRAEALPADAGAGELAALIAGCEAARLGTLNQLKAGWVERAAEMQAWLDEQTTSKVKRFDGKKLQAGRYTRWLGRLAAWAGDPLASAPDLGKGRERLTPKGLLEAVKPGAEVDIPAPFGAFEQLMRALDELPPLAPALRLHAAARVAQRLAEIKSQGGSYGFADMLTRLDEALDPATHGASAERLRQRILAQYPVALIDEFQDTSPVQLRILDRLYGIERNAPGHALLLIGDPKQAIYGFRGADIHSYLAARRATQGRHFTLATNHRSTAALVRAVNHLFTQAEQRNSSGAFGFRVADGESPLPFSAVGARGRAEVFVTASGEAPAVAMELDATLRDVRASRQLAATGCAQRIVALLNDARAGFRHPVHGFTPLRAADIAVLVRSAAEAAVVRRALQRCGVASVYLSDQDSVFASQEARDLLRWLRAVAAPRDARLARAALATRSVGLPLDELLLLTSDDAAFDARCEQLRQLHAVWQAQGVLTMLRQSLHLLGLPARWLAGNGAPGVEGERSLTNVLHLAELLQGASAQLEGEQALIRWLAAQMEEGAVGAAGADEHVLRLESDAELVQVVTVHKSKGLEYPLVFMPFACSVRLPRRKAGEFVRLTDAAGARTLVLAPSDAQRAQADAERLREDLRLLYVALTRARHALWLGLAALKAGNSASCTWQRSAMGHLLTGGDACESADLPARVAAAVAPCPGIALSVVDPQEQTPTRLRQASAPAPLPPALPYAADFDRSWGIASFSGLVRALAPAVAGTGLSAQAAVLLREDEAAPETATPAAALAPQTPPVPAAPTAPSAPWHRFARGAEAGNFLHEQLEWLAQEQFALDASPALQRQLLLRCERQGYAARAADVLAWLRAALTTPLPPLGAPLAAIGRMLPEMEFWYPTGGVDTGALDTLCRTHLLGGCQRPPLAPRRLRGMLMGFADLVFEHGGRYWVLDYKSNHLGADDAGYDTPALHAAMAAHRYDVQAALYLLALHRLLRARLGARYDPAHHLGGAIYYFLRGLRGPGQGCFVVPPDTVLINALDALLPAVGEAA